jgi:hypothetical protein
MTDMVSSASMLVVTRRRGRPPARERCVAVMTWIPVRYHDRLIQLAHKREMSVSALVRCLLERQIDSGSPPRHGTGFPY